jgi:hypothetical protein
MLSFGVLKQVVYIEPRDLKELKMKSAILRDMKSHTLIDVYYLLVCSVGLFFDPEDGGNTFSEKLVNFY